MNTTLPDAGPAATPELPAPGAPGAFSTPAVAEASAAAPTPDAGGPAPAANSTFPRHPGETPRAFSAFFAYVQLGHGRSLSALADLLGEKADTLKTWSSRHHWNQRIQAWNESLLQRHAETEADRQRQHVVDWVRRHVEAREQDWEAAQKLRLAAQCFLESFGDRDVERMTLAQVSRALQIAARLARQAVTGSTLPDERTTAPLQAEMEAALLRVYGNAVTAAPPATAAPETSLNPQP